MAKELPGWGHEQALRKRAAWIVCFVCAITVLLVAGPAALAAGGDAKIGRELFTGGVRFANGGAACISCHNIERIGFLGGGMVANDLTKAYSRFTEPTLTSILKRPPFPIMKDIFSSRPITDQEQQHLIAFFREVDRQGGAEGAGSNIFPIFGLVGMVLLVVLFHLFFARRNRGVRRQLVGGASR